eukprot:766915-Hanusia_phi.AAC.2
MRTTQLNYPPLCVDAAGPGRFVVAGGGGDQAKGLPNRFSALALGRSDVGGQSDADRGRGRTAPREGLCSLWV